MWFSRFRSPMTSGEQTRRATLGAPTDRRQYFFWTMNTHPAEGGSGGVLQAT
jgi:hypothetical protein